MLCAATALSPPLMFKALEFNVSIKSSVGGLNPGRSLATIMSERFGRASRTDRNASARRGSRLSVGIITQYLTRALPICSSHGSA